MFYIYTVNSKPGSPYAGFHNVANELPTIEAALDLIRDMKRAHPDRKHLIGLEAIDPAEVAAAIKLQPNQPK